MEENTSPTASLAILKNQTTDRKQYQKEYQKTYRKRVWRKEVVFSETEKQTIVASAVKHKHTLAEHIRKCTLAYIGKSYLNPSEDTLKELRFEIRKVGVNINQIAYKVNANGHEAFNEIELQNKLMELETIIEEFVSQPFNETVLQETVNICRNTADNIHKILS